MGKEYSQLNIGRASPMVLDGVSVETYGSRVPLKNVSSVSIEDPKTIRIVPFDKNQIKDIEKAVGKAVIIGKVGKRKRADLIKISGEKKINVLNIKEKKDELER